MGRWSYLDADDGRLPDSMVRVGYDADNQTYTYRDRQGSHWEGAPGNRYGALRQVQTSPAAPRTLPSASTADSGADNKRLSRLPSQFLRYFLSSRQAGNMIEKKHREGSEGKGEAVKTAEETRRRSTI